MRYFCLVLYSLVLLTGSYSFAEDMKEVAKAPEVAAPDAVALPSNWWDYFQADPKALESKLDEYSQKLSDYQKGISEANQGMIDTLIAKIRKNITIYRESLHPPKITSTAPSVFSDRYSVIDLIDVFEQRRLVANDLAQIEEDQTDKEQALDAAKNYQEKLKKDYAAISDRSEAKLILGLQIISYQLDSVIIQNQLTQTKQLIDAKIEDLKRRDAEVAYALKHLTSNEMQLSALSSEVSRAQAIWSTTKDALAQKEAEAGNVKPQGSDDATTARQQLLSQELTKFAIAEAAAHHRLVLMTAEYELSFLIYDSTAVDPTVIYERIVEQKDYLKQLKRQIQSWTESSKRQMERSGQALSLAANQGPSGQSETLRLAQENLLNLQKLSNEIDVSRFLMDQIDSRIGENLGTRRKRLMEALTWFKDTSSKIQGWFTTPLVYIGSSPVTAAGIIKFLIVVVIAIWLARTVSATLARVSAQRIGVRKSLIYRVNRLIYYTILIIGVILALATLGVDFSNFLLLAGAIGVGLGFGLQSIVNNFLSGIIILFESHLRVGDIIELENGSRGEIREINVRSTTIVTVDGVEILIPNSQLLNTRVGNWTLSDPFRRVHIPFTVAYGSNKEKVVQVVKEAAMELPFSLAKGVKEEPQVFLLRLGEYGMELELVVWVDEMSSTRTRYSVSEYLWKIEQTLTKNGIEIPRPRYDVRVNNF